MSFAREGLIFIGMGVAARRRRAGLAAVMWRSWPLWLLAFALTDRRALGRVLLPRSGTHRCSVEALS